MDYKDTLLLPDTSFPMRGNLPQNEPPTYNQWKNNTAYELMKSHRRNVKQSFNIHDGPPYANGNIHIGHALNKILKDIIVKLHYFSGKSVRYTPGWDCHGLPIEQQVEKALGKEKKDALPKSKIRELCREHARKYLQIQSDEFQSLGVIGDFVNPYLTMDFTFEANIYRVLCEVAKKGLLCERSKPIYWSWACETALADAEVEYKDKVSDSVFVAFRLDEQACKTLGIESTQSHPKAVIWTTTSWTLPANQAIAINPNARYVLTQEGLIFAKPLLESMIQEGLSSGEIKREFDAKELENLNAINPLNNRKSRIILGDHVLMDGGSGLVHTAPGHGEDDYYVCLKYNIEVLMPVDDKGRFSEDLRTFGLVGEELQDELIGMHIFKAQDKILSALGSNLLKHTKITHSYPHCWRSHEPVIYRATKQWFIEMDKPFLHGKSLREVALEAIGQTRFYPASGENRIRSMIENRPDWCISRQRDWGVPIAFFRDKHTQEVVLDSEVLDHVALIFERYGCDAWWDKQTHDLLPPSWQDKSQNLEKCNNILDVWFDSGSTWFAVLKSGIYDAGACPADMYLEGSDQHRGWFQSSLLLSCILTGKAPYKSVLTHGFTMDEKGEKMSKSRGNVIAPQEVLRDYGSEILRLWVALSDYQNDQKISKNILKQVSEQYKKIRNTIRFLMANTSDLQNLVKRDELGLIDRYILGRAKEVFAHVRVLFLEYDFVNGLQILQNFITNEISGIYLDLCKDSLYCDDKQSLIRRAHQSVMVLMLSHLCHILAPILTYTINEALTHKIPLLKARNVFELESLDLEMYDVDLEGVDFAKLLAIRSHFSEVLDSLKKQKSLKSGLELCVKGDFRGAQKDSMDKALQDKKFSEMVAEWLIVSDYECGEKITDFMLGDQTFGVYKSSGHKCPRCWRYMAESENELCARCKGVIEK